MRPGTAIPLRDPVSANRSPMPKSISLSVSASALIISPVSRNEAQKLIPSVHNRLKIPKEVLLGADQVFE